MSKKLEIEACQYCGRPFTKEQIKHSDFLLPNFPYCCPECEGADRYCEEQEESSDED